MPLSVLLVRPAVVADLKVMSELGTQLSAQHYGYDPRRFSLFRAVTESYGEFEELQRQYLASWLERPSASVLVAEWADEVVGYALGVVEPASFALGLERAGWIHDLYVQPPMRGRGAGRALLTAVATALRGLGASAVHLHVAEANAAGQHLFAQVGFRQTMREMRLDFAATP